MEQRVVRVSPHIVKALVIENLQLRQELGEKTAHWKLKFEELQAEDAPNHQTTQRTIVKTYQIVCK